jgi:acetoin utilization deacetylase AcuC-like enzyme
MPNSILLLTDERMLDHDTGPGHPERPSRLTAAIRAVEESSLVVERRAPRLALPKDLERVHSAAYVVAILALDGRTARLDPDTSVSPGSVIAARLACGAALELVDALIDPSQPNAGLALVRPPGHHAERDHAMGFCLFGNVAIAAAYAVDELSVERVMIIDWDVHHGNGTQHLLEDRGDILVLNLHQAGIFPHTGEVNEIGAGDGVGATINVPMPGGSRGAEYLAAFEEVVVPAANRFRPQLVLVSAGFDAHVLDRLAGQALESEDFAAMCGHAVAIANHHSGGRIGLLLEGGYELQSLSESVLRCAEVLSGGPAVAVCAEAGAARTVLDAARRMHGLG